MYTSGEDTDDSESGILKKALDVQLPHDFNPNLAPQTGTEYLQHVIYERRNCKKWVTADLDLSKFEKHQTLKIEPDNISTTTPPNLLPSIEWQNDQIQDFISARKFIEAKSIGVQNSTTLNESVFIEQFKKTTPQFFEIVQYSQEAKIRMLQLISKFLDGVEENDFPGIDRNVGCWIYAILTLIEIPLNPNFCFSIREFAKKCRKIRSKLNGTVDESIVRPLNLFICIVARFFRQLDLADP